MESLPMPSDFGGGAGGANGAGGAVVREPPSARMFVRLFIIPLMIAAGIIAIMIPFGQLAGGPKTLDQAVAELKKTTGGERTAEMLIGPASKQRYIAAQTITLRMREEMEKGMGAPRRMQLADALLDILENHTQSGEGEIQPFVILSLGRVWQVDPSQGAMDDAASVASRQRVLDALLTSSGSRRREAYVNATPVDGSPQARLAAASTRKAAVLALGFLAGRPETRQAVPVLIQKMEEDADLDIRIAAASRLGVVAARDDQAAIDALARAMRLTDSRDREIAWNAALSLAQLNRAEAGEMILMLLDRNQLKELRVHDREADAANPPPRNLTEEEQQRFLINTIEAGVRLSGVSAVRERIKAIAGGDPSPRVRAAATEAMGRNKS